VDLEFSPDQEEFRQTVRRFLADKAPRRPYVRAMLDDPRGTTDEVWRGLAELGLTGLLVPEDHGGSGLGLVDLGVALEELGRAVHPGPFLSSAVTSVYAVLGAGSPADHADLLPGLAGGSTVATLALLEPTGRYDWRQPDTVATPAHDGWSVTGTKTAVPDAVSATLLLVTARTDDGVGLFAVDPTAPDVTVEPTPSVDGTRKQGTVTLAAAPARRLGDGDASEAVATALDRTVVALVLDAVGAAEAALEMTVAYAKERVQFDRPIGAFQAVQHLCAEMLQGLELGRAGAYFALWAADAADPAEAHRAATMAKAHASEAFPKIGAAAIQVHGGIGFTWEHDVHLLYKRLLSAQQALGAETEHLEELAKLVL
jgi:alkylation response protein AidB-like acyl-CoA dehydrogenase